jgi:hypothetical protein
LGPGSPFLFNGAASCWPGFICIQKVFPSSAFIAISLGLFSGDYKAQKKENEH